MGFFTCKGFEIVRFTATLGLPRERYKVELMVRSRTGEVYQTPRCWKAKLKVALEAET